LKAKRKKNYFIFLALHIYRNEDKMNKISRIKLRI